MKSYSEIREQGTEIIQSVIDLASGSPTALIDLTKNIKDITCTARDLILLKKFEDFYNGVFLDAADAINLSAKLFENDEEKERNGQRIFDYIDKINSQECLRFFINATRSLMNGTLEKPVYQRLANVIANSLYEDLVFLSNNVIKGITFAGNATVHALANSGLMIQAGIDGNSDVEEQEYVFTKLARQMDQYAISLNDDDIYAAKCRKGVIDYGTV